MYREALKYDHMNPDILYNVSKCVIPFHRMHYNEMSNVIFLLLFSKMGVLLLEQGKSVQAMARFDQALQLDPEHEV